MNATTFHAVAPDVAASALTLAEAAQRYFDAYTAADHARSRRIAAWVRLLGAQPLQSITPDDVDHAMSILAREPAKVFSGRDADGNPIFRRTHLGTRSGPTLNRYLTALGALFTWARRTRLLPRGFESPTRHVEKLPENRGRVRYLTDEERTRLLTACRASSWPRLYAMVLLALTSGARKGELLSLRWCDVDLDRGEAVLQDTKNGDRRVLVLLPAVSEELTRFAPRDARTSLALVSRSRLRPSQPYAVSGVFREAMQAAGIRNFRFHDLRHTAASYLAQHGASLLEIAATLGHRQLGMVRRNAHLNTYSRRAG